MADRAGVKQVTIGGITYDCKAVGSLKLTKFSREAIVGVDKYHGTKWKPEVPGGELTFTDKFDLTIADFQNIIDDEIGLTLANNKNITFKQATVTDHIELTPEEGEFTITFVAADAIEN